MVSSRHSLCMADDVSDDAGRCSNALIASESFSDLGDHRQQLHIDGLGRFWVVRMLMVTIALCLMCEFVSWTGCRIPSSGSDVFWTDIETIDTMSFLIRNGRDRGDLRCRVF